MALGLDDPNQALPLPLSPPRDVQVKRGLSG